MMTSPVDRDARTTPLNLGGGAMNDKSRVAPKVSRRRKRDERR
jgi:hypothetical protein